MAVLEGASAARARAALDDLSRALLAWSAEPAGASLASGLAGVALAHSVVARSFPERGHDALAGRLLERALESLEHDLPPPSLHSGLAGIGWAVQLLCDDETAEPVAAVVGPALREVLDGGWAGSVDLIDGLVGIGVYAVERLPRADGRALLECVVDRLAASAERRGDGIVWVRDPAEIPARFRGSRTRRHVDLGVAHGVGGVVALLAAALARGVAVATSTELLERSVPWLLARRLGPGPESALPAYEGEGIAREPSRTAWCYGDLGASTAVLAAARALGRAEWTAAALEMARAAALRDEAHAHLADDGLCHGRAGNAHLFHALARATGDGVLLDASRRGFERLLDLRAEPRGPAGFTIEPGSAPFGFLAGAGGIALALAGALGDEPVPWGHALGIDLERPS